MAFTFELDDPALLFIPPSSEEPWMYPFPSVVQVIIKAARLEADGFGVANGEITRAIVTFLTATRGEEEVPETLVIEGKGYLLHGRRKEWALAQLRLFWGEVPIECSQWKWQFVFQLLQ